MCDSKTESCDTKCEGRVTKDEEETRAVDELIIINISADRESVGTFCTRVRTDRHYRCRVFHTACTVWARISFGIIQTLIGLAFPDLMLIVNKDLDEASWIFTAWFCGGMLGALMFGYAYDRLNKLAVLVTLSLGLSITTATTPWCKYYPAMLIVHLIGGGFAGAISPIVTADTIYLWKKGRARMLQITYLATTTGGILSPFFVKAFLKDQGEYVDTIKNTTRIVTSSPTNVTEYTMDGCYESENSVDFIATLCNYSLFINTMETTKLDGTEITYAYIIASGFNFIAVIFYGMTYVTQGNVYTYVVDTYDKQVDDKQMTTREKLSQKGTTRRLFLIIVIIQIMLYVTYQRHLYGIFSTYAINFLQWSMEDASNAIAGFWISCCVGRVIAIFALIKFHEDTLFLCHLIISIAGVIGFSVSCYLQISSLIVVCLCINGFGSAPILSFMLSWFSFNITLVTGRITGLVYVSIAIGSMTVPVLSGYLMNNLSYNWFLYVLIILTLLYVSVTCLIRVAYKKIKRTTDL